MLILPVDALALAPHAAWLFFYSTLPLRDSPTPEPSGRINVVDR